MDVILDRLNKSSIWKMKLDRSVSVQERMTGAEEVDNLHIDYSHERSLYLSGV
jgi:hypothetical protein